MVLVLRLITVTRVLGLVTEIAAVLWPACNAVLVLVMWMLGWWIIVQLGRHVLMAHVAVKLTAVAR